MFSSIQDINIKSLKDNHVRLYYFGLGFIQLKINDVWRLHFYSPKLPVITEDIHNHRYGFLSKVLKGSLTNHVVELDYTDSDDHKILSVSCDEKFKAPTDESYVGIKSITTDTYTVGQGYVMTPDMFHRTTANNCITMLMRTHRSKDFANVVLPRNETPVCPFSKKIEEEQLWSMIEEMLVTNERVHMPAITPQIVKDAKDKALRESEALLKRSI